MELKKKVPVLKCQRILRRIARHTGSVDVLEFVLLGLAGGLAINGTSVSAVATAVLGTCYIIFLVLKWFLTIDYRRAAYRMQGEILWGLFDVFNTELFGDDCYVRITLFRADPLSSKFIIPWFRYERGGIDAIADADQSFARYTRGEGYTGEAWKQAGNNCFSLAFVRPFADRQDFEDCYANDLHVNSEVVRGLSDYMVHVGTIISGGFCDTRGKFLGVVSIDLQWSVQPEKSEKEVSMPALNFVALNGEPRTLDTSKLATIAMTLQTVLQSLAQGRRM